MHPALPPLIQTYRGGVVDPFVQGCVSAHPLFESQLSKLLILRSQFLRLHNWFAHPVLNRLHCPCRVLVRISKLWVQIFRYKEVVGTFIWKSPGKSGFTTFPSFPDMYKIEDRIELDLKRNVRCHCSKWSTVKLWFTDTQIFPKVCTI